MCFKVVTYDNTVNLRGIESNCIFTHNNSTAKNNQLIEIKKFFLVKLSLNTNKIFTQVYKSICYVFIHYLFLFNKYKVLNIYIIRLSKNV